MKTIKINNSDEIPKNFTGIAKYPNGTKYYYVYGKLHRLDGPAGEWSDGTKIYYVKGKPHRLDGPAYEYSDGTKEYFVDGKQVTKEAQELLYNLMKLKGLICYDQKNK